MNTFSISEDRKRFLELDEEKRPDLSDFIENQEIEHSDEETIRMKRKVVDLPNFEYAEEEMGKLQEGGDGEPDDSAEGKPDDEEDGGQGAGDDEEGDFEFREMDIEEFAEEMEDELNLDLEPKGKEKQATKEGDMVDRANTGPKSTLVKDKLFKEGLKRKLALATDEEYCKEILKVKGLGPRKAFEELRNKNVRINYATLEEAYSGMSKSEKNKWENIEEFEENNEQTSPSEIIKQPGERITFREEDEEHHYPEEDTEEEKSVVIVNIRDVSGSMNQKKRDLVERVFAPIDWTLAGKYDNAEFVYIAHTGDAVEVERDEFFNAKSGGSTIISSGYELAKEILEEEYPWEEWNRYVLAAGDGQNKNKKDSRNKVAPLVRETPANLHAYLQVNPRSSKKKKHSKVMEKEVSDLDNYVGVEVQEKEDIIDAIKTVFETEVKNND